MRTGREPIRANATRGGASASVDMLRARGRRSLRAARPRVEAPGAPSGPRLRPRVVRGRALVAERGHLQDHPRLRGPLLDAPRAGARDRRRAHPHDRRRRLASERAADESARARVPCGLRNLRAWPSSSSSTSSASSGSTSGSPSSSTTSRRSSSRSGPASTCTSRYGAACGSRSRSACFGLSLVVELWNGGSSLSGVGVLACLVTALAYAAYVLMAEHVARARPRRVLAPRLGLRLRRPLLGGRPALVGVPGRARRRERVPARALRRRRAAGLAPPRLRRRARDRGSLHPPGQRPAPRARRLG